jgi:hypothetical protein
MSEGKIYAAISAVMNDVGAVSKNDKNDYDKYKYRGIDAVMNALSPAMVKNKVFVIPQVLESSREERAGKSGGSMIYSIVKVKYTFYTDDGSSVESIVIGEAMDRSDKSTNKAMSAAFKYACFQTFCIPTEEMKDSEDESPEVAPKDQKQSYPKREEMLNVIRERYPNGSKGQAALLASNKLNAVDDMTDAQAMAVYNHIMKERNNQ